MTDGGQSRIDQMLADARSQLQRVDPRELAAEVAAGALVVDIRPVENRQSEGELPGAVVIDRNVLEWRLDPTSVHRIAGTAPDRRIVLVCNEGYQSSLAAAGLQRLGLEQATDLIGGYRQWRSTGGATESALSEPVDEVVHRR
jgi:rhodanese-related sulfurtransferase